MSESKLKKMTSIQISILKFLDNAKSKKEAKKEKKIFDMLKVQKSTINIGQILHLLISIANNHHRGPNFFSKIDQIMTFFLDEIKKSFSSSELLNNYSENHRILLFFIENKLINIDEYIINVFSRPSNINYFFPEIESFYAEQPMNYEGENLEKYKIYEEKRKLGENDDAISTMIRSDSVKEFITYVNKNNINLNSTIKYSNFETNEFLKDKDPSFIEYAAFYGSIQIFQYLKMNKVKLTSSLWLYAIHSNNPELIHILEDNHVKPQDKSYKECVIEAIKCHHNEIVDYLINYKNINEFNLREYLKYDNYDRLLKDSVYYKDKPLDLKYLYDCFNEYSEIVDLLIRESYLDVNFKIVLKL